MTPERAADYAEKLRDLADDADDGTTLGRNVAAILRGAAGDVEAEPGVLAGIEAGGGSLAAAARTARGEGGGEA